MNDVKSHKSSKDERIQSMEPMLHNKTLILNDRHTMLLDQMAQYPFGDYVDSLDALQQALESVFRPKTRMVKKPGWL